LALAAVVPMKPRYQEKKRAQYKWIEKQNRDNQARGPRRPIPITPQAREGGPRLTAEQVCAKKRTFSSAEAAMLIATDTTANGTIHGESVKRELYAYECAVCGFWHLATRR
jgi:hypothetical protein